MLVHKCKYYDMMKDQLGLYFVNGQIEGILKSILRRTVNDTLGGKMRGDFVDIFSIMVIRNGEGVGTGSPV